MTPLVAQNLDDKSGITEANKSIQRSDIPARIWRDTSNWIYCKTRPTEQEVAERGTIGGTICPEQSDRNSIPTGTGDGEDVPDHETVGGELGASRAIKTGQKKRLLGGIKKTKTLWEN